MSDVKLTDSGYYNAETGVLYSRRYRCEVELLGKQVDDTYLTRCAEYFEQLPDSILEALKAASVKYLNEFLGENEGNLDVGELAEVTMDNVMNYLEPVRLTVTPHAYLTDDDAPPAFSIEVIFSPVPDERFEWAVCGDKAVYVGECRGVNPWNENLLSKKWNYLCGE